MSITDCQLMGVNFLVVSSAGDRLMEFNGDSEDFLTAIDGGELDAPSSIVCVSELVCLVSNYDAGQVRAVNLRGEDMGVVINLVGWYIGDLLHIENLGLIAVVVRFNTGLGMLTETETSKILFFGVGDLDSAQELKVTAKLSLALL
jgi:hypothetical protein